MKFQSCKSPRRAPRGFKLPLFVFASLALLSSACATGTKSGVMAATDAEAVPHIPEVSKVLVEDILATDAKIEPTPHGAVPIETNANVQRWLDYFAIKDRARFSQFLERGSYYRELVQGILKEEGVPTEMYYLAMIESGYMIHATSRVRAVGAWQFMKATGKQYGLKVKSDLDERRDVVRATRAAAKYLNTLHDEFNSWYLAMAAYNAGEGRIRRAIRRGGTTDFWTLAENRNLPRETMDYVPKFLAAVIIGENPEKYGFEVPSAEVARASFPSVKKVEVPGRVPLREVAKLAEVEHQELQRLNPHLIRGRTPGDVKSYAIWVPEDKADLLEEQEAELAELRRNAHSFPELRERPSRSARQASLRHNHSRSRAAVAMIKVHRVRRGETLGSISKRYGVSVRKLRKINRLSSNSVQAGQMIRLRKKGDI